MFFSSHFSSFSYQEKSFTNQDKFQVTKIPCSSAFHSTLTSKTLISRRRIYLMLFRTLNHKFNHVVITSRCILTILCFLCLEPFNQTNILQQLIALPNPLEFRYYSRQKSCSDNIKTVFIRIKEIPYALGKNIFVKKIMR
jgi:hypothetical protein